MQNFKTITKNTTEKVERVHVDILYACINGDSSIFTFFKLNMKFLQLSSFKLAFKYDFLILFRSSYFEIWQFKIKNIKNIDFTKLIIS